MRIDETAVPERAPVSAAVVRSLDHVGQLTGLDLVATPLARLVRAFPLGRFRDIAHGLPLGHPLHPALVLLPLGSWLSAAALDTVPGTRRPARFLVGAGVLTAAPAAVTGWLDWAELHAEQRRTGLVHAVAGSAATALYAASWVERGRGRTVRAKALGFLGLAAAGAGGMMGGHLAYRQGAGTNKAASVAHLVADRWYPVGQLEDFPVGRAVRRMAGEVPVLVVREADGRMLALADRCSHLAGPLSDGRIFAGCVQCPWHASVFRLTDGAVVRGPATAPQPSFRVTVRPGGEVCVAPSDTV
ncbi:Rieske 2Fe-2S domain-containing protein [Streptomyces sp. NPDC014733]|uniref:Rieske 2Fe-2S domain-containing protein n=1 Tax=Streptomyces sp. NPDC014733 TaxID=3364885 RepID=UPI0036F7AB14